MNVLEILEYIEQSVKDSIKQQEDVKKVMFGLNSTEFSVLKSHMSDQLFPQDRKADTYFKREKFMNLNSFTIKVKEYKPTIEVFLVEEV